MDWLRRENKTPGKDPRETHEDPGINSGEFGDY
jgi:hypothetical protein